MNFNIYFTDVKKFKKLMVILLVILFIVVLVSAVFLTTKRNDLPGWAKSKPQDINDIKDVKVAMPYITHDYSIYYVKDTDSYFVDYNGYMNFDQVELRVVLWFKENTDFRKAEIKFGNMGGQEKTYDLTKSISELLPNNSELTPKTDAPYSTDKQAE